MSLNRRIEPQRNARLSLDDVAAEMARDHVETRRAQHVCASSIGEQQHRNCIVDLLEERAMSIQNGKRESAKQRGITSSKTVGETEKSRE